ncbi:hypothetical protein PG990_013268 [Apiospora arundinis]|uniref:Uncharacterized protein n=1 Tax=Apiospora arundinis TaxID=335852 RepID=A0ABR2HSX7_9PEZI
MRFGSIFLPPALVCSALAMPATKSVDSEAFTSPHNVHGMVVHDVVSTKNLIAYFATQLLGHRDSLYILTRDYPTSVLPSIAHAPTIMIAAKGWPA